MREKIFNKFKIVLDNMKYDHISESAAECAYYVILSFIPFIILLLTLIQYTSIESNQLFETISNIIPDSMNEMVLGIVREVYSKSIGTISISLIFTLYSASKGLFALMKELHFIYNFTDHKNKSWIYLKAISLFQTVVFIAIVTLSLVAMVFGKTIVATAKENFGLLKNYTINDQNITQIIFLIGFFIIFLLMYRFLSRHKMKLKSQIRGAIFASIAINVISYIFSRYLEIFKGFSTTYGSLTTLMLVMMWTYACFYVIFLGAEINKFHGTESQEEALISNIKEDIKKL